MISRSFLKNAMMLAFVTAVRFGAQAVDAQAIPGIYGGASPSELGTYRYVQLQGASGSTYTLPLNGILNYVAYYVPSGTSSGTFIPGGEYSIYYLNAAQAVVGSAGTVTYSPNSGYTNGVEVSPPNPGASGALGIQGIFNYPGATARLYTSSGSIVDYATVNGDGFFSFYYSPTGFVTAGTYTVEFSARKVLDSKCEDLISGSATGTYSPTNTTNPNATSYYVTGAATNLGTIPVKETLVCH